SSGEEGYPGNLSVSVTYTLKPDMTLEITYRAVTDAATPVNLTSHAYFNLSGDFTGKITAHHLMINAGLYLPVNEHLIPTGEQAAVTGTPFDFTRPVPIGDRLEQQPGGFDHTFILPNPDKRLIHAATLAHPDSGRTMDVYTTEP